MGSQLYHDGVFCMTGGTGETSYATNSSFQKKAIKNVEAMLRECIESICLSIKPECLTIADLGCSSGPNAIGIVQSVIDVAVSTCQSSGITIPEFNAYMNDLPQNDFNTIFKSFPGFYKQIKQERGNEITCFISGTPGCFYQRLFPTNFIHFMHSSYSLHWRSQVPEGIAGYDGKEGLNDDCIYARKQSPPEVLQAYHDLCTKDLTIFLKCRSKEIVYGGRMLLTMPATNDNEISICMESLSKALNNLASKGLINKEKLKAFNLAFHRPTMKQAKQVIEEEGSFAIHQMNSFPMHWNIEEEDQDDNTKIENARKSAKSMAKTLRAAIESVLVATFGEGAIDDIFNGVEEVAMDYFWTHKKAGQLNLVISLIKI